MDINVCTVLFECECRTDITDPGTDTEQRIRPDRTTDSFNNIRAVKLAEKLNSNFVLKYYQYSNYIRI